MKRGLGSVERALKEKFAKGGLKLRYTKGAAGVMVTYYAERHNLSLPETEKMRREIYRVLDEANMASRLP